MHLQLEGKCKASNQSVEFDPSFILFHMRGIICILTMRLLLVGISWRTEQKIIRWIFYFTVPAVSDPTFKCHAGDILCISGYFDTDMCCQPGRTSMIAIAWIPPANSPRSRTDLSTNRRCSIDRPFSLMVMLVSFSRFSVPGLSFWQNKCVKVYRERNPWKIKIKLEIMRLRCYRVTRFCFINARVNIRIA